MRTLRDPTAADLLFRDGFAKLSDPLVDHVGAKELRDRFLTMCPGPRTGFHSDLSVPDPTYRRQVANVIGEALDAPIRGLFDGFEPFLYNFLCKWPGADSGLYLHQDWMYVDERTGARTYVVWVPLQDTVGHNGQLRVLRTSHRIDHSIRGTGLTAPWLEHVSTIERRLVSLPVRCGHGVVFDNALVHCSYPNHTDDPRVVVAVGLRPAASPLTYFRRSPSGGTSRYEVDESFFLDYTPQQLADSPPRLHELESLDAVSGMDLTVDELCEALDTGLAARADRMHGDLAHLRRSLTAGARRTLERATSTAHAGTRRIRSAADRLAAIPETIRGLAESAAVLRSRMLQAKQMPGTLLRRFRDLVAVAPARAAGFLLRLNEAIIDRFGPDQPAVWDPTDFAWTSAVESAWPSIRAEVEQLLAGPTDIPHIEDVTGGIPQGNEGPWRSFVLMHQGKWMEWNCSRCPRTTAAVRDIPGLTVAGFSVLEPGTHITPHRGPNKGALRYQLGVMVPEPEGSCRIRIGDQMVWWHEHESLVFDFTVEHEAWNDSSELRVLLMLEVITPLPLRLAVLNRVAQKAMGWHPATRSMRRRLRDLEPALLRHDT